MQEEMLWLQSIVAQLQETLATMASNCPSPTANQVAAPVFSISVNRQSSISSHVAPSPEVVLAPHIIDSTQENNVQARNLEGSMPKRRKTVNNSCHRVLSKSASKPEITVAQGTLLNKNSSTKVGGFELGAAFWEVHVEVPFVVEEPLMRPYGCYRTIGDAVGSSVAWLTSLVVDM
ncbi:PREDICTED: uncharacterized protein LOC104596073 isoform X3 [Nelumbo nucifera]|nr:PREDICTED: uncharacterized protein LOC104596073 isoform X3 [Nelumbo nucifera]XP_019053087.1 PREDICTED: uncharacterized protein LOC104596073 isoform X3 [Nelumbo nucifera]DAD18912.1 TPA_asm: hypothetical protein HUJ06_020375 [Nelumbo nucifera]